MLKKATCVDLPLVNRSQSPMIALGDSPAARAAGLQAADVPEESFRIQTRNGNLYIVGRDTPQGGRTPGGGTSHGTWFGVMEFLERLVGARWLMPGEIGEDVPAQPALRISPSDGDGWCQCPSCAALDERCVWHGSRQYAGISLTRRILTFCSAVARLVRVRLPDARLCGYATVPESPRVIPRKGAGAPRKW